MCYVSRHFKNPTTFSYEEVTSSVLTRARTWSHTLTKHTPSTFSLILLSLNKPPGFEPATTESRKTFTYATVKKRTPSQTRSGHEPVVTSSSNMCTAQFPKGIIQDWPRFEPTISLKDSPSNTSAIGVIKRNQGLEPAITIHQTNSLTRTIFARRKQIQTTRVRTWNHSFGEWCLFCITGAKQNYLQRRSTSLEPASESHKTGVHYSYSKAKSLGLSQASNLQSQFIKPRAPPLLSLRETLLNLDQDSNL